MCIVKGWCAVEKKFVISSRLGSNKEELNANVPQMDRFRRIEQLNDMLTRGWQIKEFNDGFEESYFMLEKRA